MSFVFDYPMKHVSLFLFFTLFAVTTLTAQQIEPNAPNWVSATVVEGDTVPLVYLDYHSVKAPRIFKSKKERQKFNRLKYNVKKVYPYAKMASELLIQYEDSIANAETERERKKFYKMVENDLRAEYEEELMKLTVSQGRILIKLIDRETGSTSYNLVKELRNTITAFFWQGLARLFGNDLKEEYDPNGKDKDIEQIMLALESS